MEKPKTLPKNIKNIEKLFQLMKKYQISQVKVDGFEAIKNYHELPAPKKSSETNGESDHFLEEIDKWKTSGLNT